MKRRLDQIGRALLHTAIFFMVAMVVLQGAITLQPLNLFAGWAEKMPANKEWASVMVHAPLLEEPAAVGNFLDAKPVQLTVGLKDITALPYCHILVNGQAQASFDQKNITLSVKPGDLLEVDATYYNFPIAFEILSGPENLKYPRLNQQFQVEQGIVLLGEVHVTQE